MPARRAAGSAEPPRRPSQPNGKLNETFRRFGVLRVTTTVWPCLFVIMRAWIPPVGAAVGVTAVTAGENVGGVLLPEGGGTPEEARAELDVVVGGDLRGRRAGHRGLCSRHGAEGHEAQGHPQQHRDRLWYAS